MNARYILALCALLLGSAPALPQGFAGMSSDASGFTLPQRGKAMDFPADHGPHPDYRIEWWYLTATLRGDDGRDYGIQWTLFRAALAPGEADGWQSPQIWMGHAALTSAHQHLFAERLARGGIGQAGVTAAPFEAWIDDWSMTGQASPGEDQLSALRLTARGAAFSYDLQLDADGPLVLHGDRGYSVKSRDGQASNYYSQPGYRVTGTVSLADGPVRVTGNGWLDREWSSQPLSPDQTGWDWISLTFDDGAKLMGYRLRGGGPAFVSGTWIAADGTATPLSPGALEMAPVDHAAVAGRDVPVRWSVSLADRGLDIEVDALNRQSWMGTSVPYWEGPVTVTGSHTGRGYLEMTGYDP